MSRVENLHRNFANNKDECYLCGVSLRRGEFKGQRLFYLMGGATADSEDPICDQIHQSPGRLEGFLHIGSHGVNSENDVDVAVVRGASFGQFDVQFCSIGCFRTWMLEVLALIESTAQAGD